MLHAFLDRQPPWTGLAAPWFLIEGATEIGDPLTQNVRQLQNSGNVLEN